MEKFTKLIWTAVVIQSAVSFAFQVNDNQIPNHPRVVVTSTALKKVIANLEKDIVLRKVAFNVKVASDGWVAYPQVAAQLLASSPDIFTRSRRCIMIESSLASAYLIEQNPLKKSGYGAGAKAILLSFASTINENYNDNAKRAVLLQNTGYLLFASETATCLAIGYDWIYPLLSAQEKIQVRQALASTLSYSLPMYDQKMIGLPGYNHSFSNWNPAVNGGFSLGALALLENPSSANYDVGQQTLAKSVIDRTTVHISHFLNSIGTSGYYWEGPNYWNFAFSYLSLMEKAFSTALGVSLNLDAGSLALQKTHQFMMALYSKNSPFLRNGAGTLYVHTFSDSSPYTIPNLAALSWFAERNRSGQTQEWVREMVKQPGFIDTYAINTVNNYHVPFMLFQWPMQNFQVEVFQSPTLKEFKDSTQGAIVEIERKGSVSPIYLGVKAGQGKRTHAHLDSGSFILDAFGRRWFSNLPSESYDVDGYFSDTARWQYFRTNSLGRNTLTIDGKLQAPNASGVVLSSTENATQSQTELDLSSVYGESVTLARRKFMMNHQEGTVQVTDNLKLRDIHSQVVWTTIHCVSERPWGAGGGSSVNPVKLSPGPNGNNSRVTLGEDSYPEAFLEMTVASPANAMFSVMSADPVNNPELSRVTPASAQVNSSRGLSENTNASCYLIRINVPQSAIATNGDLSIQVNLKPVEKKFPNQQLCNAMEGYWLWDLRAFAAKLNQKRDVIAIDNGQNISAQWSCTPGTRGVMVHWSTGFVDRLTLSTSGTLLSGSNGLAPVIAKKVLQQNIGTCANVAGNWGWDTRAMPTTLSSNGNVTARDGLRSLSGKWYCTSGSGDIVVKWSSGYVDHMRLDGNTLTGFNQVTPTRIFSANRLAR